MNTQALWHDLRCIVCGCEDISFDKSQDLFSCHGCGKTFGRVMGVPFLGQFEEDDVLGLIEIAANVVNRGKFGVTPEVVDELECLLNAYDQSPDKAAFSKTIPEAQLPFFPNRYNEWLEITRLTADLDLRGMKVLDMGAGLGFDSYRLARRGACVTALEYSPLLAEWGHQQFPGMRWVGGFSHCLPFRNGSFDAVFCNAALHHMKDIPAAISEALRVLRPGGYLITTCDSFRASDSDENTELESFDHQEAVLMGVNERVPKFSEFTETILLHPELLDIEIYTHLLHDPLTGEEFSELTRWVLYGDWDKLSRSAGSLAMRIKLKAPWPEKARCQKSTVLDPGEYASWLTDASSAVARLSPLMPEQYVNTPLVGSSSTKFELLNGWRLQKPFQMFRTAYRRGRWFLRRSVTERMLSFEIALPPSSVGNEEIIRILLNGEVLSEQHARRLEWTEICLDLSHIPAEKVFIVELQKQGGADTLTEACFLVRNRKLVSIADNRKIASIPTYPRVFAVIPVFNRLHFTRECINYLKSQTYPSITIIVADGGSTDGTVETIRSEHPDVIVLTSDKELWWSGSMAMGIEYVLQKCERPDDFVLMMNNDTVIPQDYVSNLVFASQCHNAAVGALIVDSCNPDIILDAGEYIDWMTYSFPVKTTVSPRESFCGDVDFLPGRGSLVPLKMIHASGNVDAGLWPHYLADYEFFYRLKSNGFGLGVCYETKVFAHIGETGLIHGSGPVSFSVLWMELFSRRSMSNVVDHWRFIERHAPDRFRYACKKRMVKFVLHNIAHRTILRFPLLPLNFTWRIVQGQRSSFALFFAAIKRDGADVLCYPHKIPGLIRLPLYILACPGPLRSEDCSRLGVGGDALIAQGVLRRLSIDDWYGLATLDSSRCNDSSLIKRLIRSAYNPMRKLTNSLAWWQSVRRKREHAE